MKIFFEASALTKAFATEAFSADVQRDFRAGPPFIAALSLAEVPSALSRICREGLITPEERDHQISRLNGEISRMVLLDSDLEIVRLAQKLLCAHILRASDAIQLATYLSVQRDFAPDLRFLCFDKRLTKAAEKEHANLLLY